MLAYHALDPVSNPISSSGKNKKDQSLFYISKIWLSLTNLGWR